MRSCVNPWERVKSQRWLKWSIRRKWYILGQHWIICVLLDRNLPQYTTIPRRAHFSYSGSKRRSKWGQKGQKGQSPKIVANGLKCVQNEYFTQKTVPTHYFNTLYTLWSKTLEPTNNYLLKKFSKSRAGDYGKQQKCLKTWVRYVLGENNQFSICFRPFATFLEIWPFRPWWPIFDLYSNWGHLNSTWYDPEWLKSHIWFIKKTICQMN